MVTISTAGMEAAMLPKAPVVKTEAMEVMKVVATLARSSWITCGPTKMAFP